MNKILLATVLFIPLVALAAVDEAPTPQQSAISLRGTCAVFQSETEVPSDWKIVDSCENYETENIGASPEEVLRRRWESRVNAYSAIAAKETEEVVPVLGRSRIGSGTLTRGGADRVVSLGTTSNLTRRTSTLKNYGTTKQYLLNDPRRITTTAEEWKERRTARSGIKSGSATEMERRGKLSGSFWSTEMARRNQRLEDQESTEGWEDYLDNRQYLSKQGRREEKEYVYEGPTLRRIYRGPRLEGNIQRTLLDIED